MITLRQPRPDEVGPINALILRSKSYWGYDEAFMSAVRPDLELKQSDIDSHCRVAEHDGRLAGVTVLSLALPDAEIEQMFVEPAAMGTGVGRALFDWCATTAARVGADHLWVVSDPNAASFYMRMGMVGCGEQRSTSASGRMLPRLMIPLPAAGSAQI